MIPKSKDYDLEALVLFNLLASSELGIQQGETGYACAAGEGYQEKALPLLGVQAAIDAPCYRKAVLFVICILCFVSVYL